MNSRKKQNGKKSGPLQAIGSVIGIIILINIAEAVVELFESENLDSAAVAGFLASAILPILFLVGLLCLFRFLARRITQEKAGDETARRPAPRGAAAHRPGTALGEIAPVFRSLGRKKEECDYGTENHEYSHDMARRVEQLDSFLRNGLIDKAEYDVLLRKYREALH